ncbi:MAG: hypothetical protein JWN95_1825 [Frankiales bacterium]|nr:hypothetical protein [Frankiales bacterium]
MNSQAPLIPAAANLSADAQTIASVRAQTLAWQSMANRIVRGLLRTPLICRVVGNRLVTVYVVGRKSGRRYTIPVAYLSYDGTLLIGTPFGWGRNLRTGEPVDIRFKGKRQTVEVEVVSAAAGVIELYGAMARKNRQFAKFNKIGVGPTGEPDPTDLRQAWAAGARAIRLTLR